MEYLLNLTIGLCNEAIISGNYNLIKDINKNYQILFKSKKVKDSDLIDLKNLMYFTNESINEYWNGVEYKINNLTKEDHSYDPYYLCK